MGAFFENLGKQLKLLKTERSYICLLDAPKKICPEDKMFTPDKLYLHMYDQNAIEMDWDQPLSAFGGLTGYQVAEAGYQQHVSQHEAGQKNPETGKFEYFIVEPRESKYSCYRFGLAYTVVGYDVNGNDFFENIPGY